MAPGGSRPGSETWAIRGLKRCLKRMGILPDAYAVDPPERETRLMAMQTGDNYIFASADGLFEPRVELGDEVEDGHFAGYIWSVREPWRPPVELWFNRGGVVFCKRHPALCEIGDTLFFALNDYQG